MPTRCSAGTGCGRRLGVGLTAVCFAGIGLAFRGDAPRSGAFLAVFLAIGLVILTVVVFFARGCLGTGFLAFWLSFSCGLLSLRHYSLPDPWIFKTCAESLLDKMRVMIILWDAERRRFISVLDRGAYR